MTRKKVVNFTLSEKTQARLAALAHLHELSKAGIVERALKEMADRDGVTLPDTPAPTPTPASPAGSAVDNGGNGGEETNKGKELQ